MDDIPLEELNSQAPLPRIDLIKEGYIRFSGGTKPSYLSLECENILIELAHGLDQITFTKKHAAGGASRCHDTVMAL